MENLCIFLEKDTGYQRSQIRKLVRLENNFLGKVNKRNKTRITSGGSKPQFVEI